MDWSRVSILVLDCHLIRGLVKGWHCIGEWVDWSGLALDWRICNGLVDWQWIMEGHICNGLALDLDWWIGNELVDGSGICIGVADWSKIGIT